MNTTPHATTLENLLHLEQQGAGFVPVTKRGKEPCGADVKDWQNNPKTVAQVKAHVDAGGNVGLICGKHSDNLAFIDTDTLLPECLAEPALQGAPLFHRENAPERGKFLVRFPDCIPGTKRVRGTPSRRVTTLNCSARAIRASCLAPTRRARSSATSPV